MEEIKNNKFGQLIIKIISILFSVFFVIILFNIIFFNRTIAINYKIPTMIIGTCIEYIIMFAIYSIYKKKKFDFLEYKLKKIDIICVLLIVFAIQHIFTTLTCNEIGWDCGIIIHNAVSLLNEGHIDCAYYSHYPNNIGIFLLIKYVLVIGKQFTGFITISNAFFVSIIFNIIMVDIAALFTFLTIRKVLGNKNAYFSLIFIAPFIIFSPYILVPYTDTITMLFPIMSLYLYIIIKELQKNCLKKYLLIFLEGLFISIGTFLKPTVIIVLISIIIMEILSIKVKKIEKKHKIDKVEKLKNIKNILNSFMYLIIVLILFMIGFATSYIGYSKIKEKNLGTLISQEEYNNNSVSFTHFLMMGMQEQQNDTKKDGKNQILYGSYNDNDVRSTIAIKGYKEKQKYNLQIIKERLNNFGIIGYLKFLNNKVNWILSDGTFFYGQEGIYKGSYYNQSKIAKSIQQFIDVQTDTYKNIIANIMQILWILVILGLVFSIKNEENNYISIGKLSIIGIILFILLFEGRSRYLINYIPIFILVGIYGLINSFDILEKGRNLWLKNQK